MGIKKFDKLDMRDDFSFPIYLGYNLAEFNGIKGIDPDNRYAAQLTHENGKTYLELSDFPSKENYHSNGIVYDHDDKIQTHKDTHDWYGTTWDGSLLFVFHKFVRVGANEMFSSNSFSADTSKWLITDFSIVKQFMLMKGVAQVKITLDYTYAWFGIFKPEQDFDKKNSQIYTGLKFMDQHFELTIGAEGVEEHQLHYWGKTVDLFVLVKFSKMQSRDFTYRLAVVLRNFFQILIGKSVGITRMILNSDQSYDSERKMLLPRNYRENWFLDQSYLPDEPKESLVNFNVPYKQISKTFSPILTQYLIHQDVQNLLSTFLSVDQFSIPVDTQIVTLVSGIESYYRNAKYSNGKPVKDALRKLQRFVELIDQPDDVITNGTHGNIVDTKQLLQEMIDARDFVVHGDKADKYTSETELVPDLIAFKRLIRCGITEIITLKHVANNG